MALKIKQFNASAPILRGNNNKNNKIIFIEKLADIINKMSNAKLIDSSY